MAAVVSGSGLGLFNTSLAQLGQAHGGQAAVGQALEGQYVNVATGNLVLQDQDESILTRGLPISFVRTYNSLGMTGGVGQDGWLHGFERRVTGLAGTVNTTGSTVRRVLGDGTETVFTWDAAANAYLSTDGSGAHDTLTWNATNSRWTWTEGSNLQREVYDDSGTRGGRLMTILDVKSGATYNLGYNSSGRLISVVSSLANGDGLYFTYDASNRLQSINTRENGISHGQVWFEYDSFGRLQSVLTDLAPDTVAATTTLSPKTGDNDGTGNLDGRLFRTTYTYVSSSPSDLRIASITQSDGTVVSYGYVGSTGQIATVTRGDTNANDADGLGETLTFAYRAGETDVTDRFGRVTTYVWDAAAGNRLREVRMPADGQGIRDVMVYGYSDSVDPGLVTTVETRRGAAVVSRQEFEYDARGNLVRHWSVLDAATGRSQRIDRTYSATNQLLTETTYTVFDTDGRGSLSPAPMEGRTVRYLYDSTTGTASTTTNGNKLRFIIDADGRVTEYVYQTSGSGNGLVRSIRRFEDVYTSTTFTTSALNTWATNYTRASRSTLTDFLYDAMGRVSERHDFPAVVGAGIGYIDILTKITRFTYDAQGLLRQEIVVRGHVRDTTGYYSPGDESMVTSYAYDGMGRLTATVRKSAISGMDDAETISTTVAYLDGARSIVTTMDSGAVQTEVRNAAGRVVSSTLQSAAGMTAGQRESSFIYDAAGQLRASRDASGAARYFLYDEDGRLSTEVDATGAVIAYTYDANGQRTRTTAYANRVSLPAWPSGRDGLPTAFAIQPDAARDRVSTREYDLAGRLTAEVDGEGVRVEFRYDAAGRIERRIETGAAGATDDRITRYFYDKSDRQIGVLDAEGFLKQFTYDGVGRMIKTTSYATVVPPTNREATTLAGLAVVADATRDRVVRTYYNSRDQKVGEIDAEGYFTFWQFDEVDGGYMEDRFANRPEGVLESDNVDMIRARIPDQSGAVTSKRFNALGQLKVEYDRYGEITTEYHYDEAGRLVRTMHAPDSPRFTGQARDSVLHLNSFGEVIGEISGESLRRALVAYAHLGITTAEALQNASEADKAAVFASHGTRHVYDTLGRKIETRDASGAAVWFFYDAASRLTHTLTGVAGEVDGNAGAANGQVEIAQTRYDAFGQIIGTTSYSGRGQLSVANSRAAAQALVDSLNAGAAITWRDAWGNSLSDVDAQRTSAQVTMEYDRAGRQTLLTQAIGLALGVHTSTHTTYTAFGQIDTVSLANGNAALQRTTTFTYDRRGIVSSTSESGGGLTRTTAVKTDAFGNAYEWSDARGVITSATHDRLGRQLTLTKSVDGPTGTSTTSTSTTTYDAWSRVLTHIDASGRTQTMHYGINEPTVTVVGFDGSFVVSTRNRHGETTSVKVQGGTRTHNGVSSSAEDQETVFEYDRSGRLIKTTRKGVDDQAGAAAAQSGYDARGLMAWSTDADGRRTIYRYDAAGRQLESILDPSEADATAFGITGLSGFSAEPLRIKNSVRVDGLGRAVEMTDGVGTVTRYEYDRAGRQTRIIVDPDGLNLQTTIEHDELGQTVLVREGDTTNSDLKVTRYVYDGLGRRVAEHVDPAGLNLTTTYRYDLADNLVARFDATGHAVRYAYDGDNRLRFEWTTRSLLSAKVIEHRYDGAGQRIETRESLDWVQIKPVVGDIATADTFSAALDVPTRVTGFRYDLSGQLEAVTNSLGYEERYVYNIRGERVARIDRAGAMWRYQYDAAGRLVAEVSPSVTITQIGPDGTLTHAERAITTRYQLDGSGRRVALIEDAGTATQRTTLYAYDRAGRLTSTTFPKAGDWEGAVFNANAGAAPTAQQRFDAAGRTVVSIDASGAVTRQAFDSAGRLRFVVAADGAVTETRYLDGGMRVETHRYAERYTLPAHQGAVDLATLAEWAAAPRSGTRDQTEHFDAAGRLASVVGAAVEAFDQTGASLGTQRPETRFRYDAAGRVLQESVKLTDEIWAITTHYYDVDGRRTLSVDAMGHATTMSYSPTGNLLSVTEHAAAIVGWAPTVSGPVPVRPVPEPPSTEDEQRIGADRTTSYLYDALGRRIAETRADGAITEFEYDSEDRQTATIRKAADNVAAAGQPAQWVDARTEQRFDAAGRLVAVIEPTRRALRADAEARLLAGATLESANIYTDAAPLTLTAYDAFGQMVAMRRVASGWRAGESTRWTQVTANTADEITRLQRDLQGRVVAEHTAGGRVTRMRYDAMDRMIESRFTLTQGGGGAPLHEAISTFQYDALGRQTQAVEDGHRQDAEFNAFGEVVSRWFDGNAGDRTRVEYDDMGRIRAGVAGDGTLRTYGYTLAGSQVVERQTIPGAATPATTVSVVDLLGRTTRILLPLSDQAGADATERQSQLDRWGNEIGRRNALGFWTYRRFDAANRLIEERLPEVSVLQPGSLHTGAASRSGVRTWTYGTWGDLVEFRDANRNAAGNGAATEAQDANLAGQVTQATDAVGVVTLRAYDLLGRLRFVQVRDNRVSFSNDTIATPTDQRLIQGFRYRQDGAVAAHFDLLPTAGSTVRVARDRQAFTLNELGQRITVTNDDGTVERYRYDGLGRVVYASANGVERRTQYGGNGQKVSESDGVGTQSWQWNANGQLLSTTEFGGRTTTFTYDANGIKTSEEIAKGDVPLIGRRTFTYYANGLVNAVTETEVGIGASVDPVGVYSYFYDAEGQRVRESAMTRAASAVLFPSTRPVPAAGRAYEGVTTSTFDGLGRLTGVSQEENKTEGWRRVFEATYDYDLNGNRIRVRSQSDLDDGWTTPPSGTPVTPPDITDEWFSYDAANRVLVRQGAFSGDAVVVDNTNVDSALISYTARGEVASEQRVERQLDAAGRPVGDLRIVTTIEPRYDERGRLLGEWITNPRQGQAGEPALIPLRRLEYFPDNAGVGSGGKIKSEIHYFGAGISAPNPPEGVDGLLTGRLSQVVQYTYDAEGRMTRQDRFGQRAMPQPPPPPVGGELEPVDPEIDPNDPNELYLQDLAAWWIELTQDPSGRRTADGASLANQLTLLSRTHYHFDATMPPVPGYPNRPANGRLTRYANEVLSLGYGEKASDHFDDDTSFQPYVQYHEIRGYAGTGGGWQEDWVVGNRLNGAYNAGYRIPYSSNDDADTTVSRLFDAFGRVSHQYEYLDIPGTGRKNQHRVRGYAYNADGQVISRRDYSAIGADRNWAPETVMPERRFVISNGNQVAELTIGAPARNDDPAIEGLQQLAGSTPYRAGGGQVSVQSGDTLSSIAQRVYGNSSYWYVLADANGVGSPDEALIAGTLLEVPSVGVSRNSADTFKPYDASEALGPSTPVLPYIAPSPNSCGVVGRLIMVVVAVIATIYTAGAAAGALTTAAGTTGTAFATAATATTASSLTALGGAVVGAASGFAGALASNLVGSLTGVSSFSWRSVAAGTVSGALTGGIAPGIQGVDSLRGIGAAVGRAAVGNAVQSVANGGGFSWRGVAASVAGAAAGSLTTQWLTNNTWMGNGSLSGELLSELSGGVVSMHTRRLVGSGELVDYGNVLASSVGTMIGGRLDSARRLRAEDQALNGVGGVGTGAQAIAAQDRSGDAWVNGGGEQPSAGAPTRAAGETGATVRQVTQQSEARYLTADGRWVTSVDRSTRLANGDLLTPTIHVSANAHTNGYFMDQWEYAIRHGMTAPTRADWDHIDQVRLANDARTRPAWSAHVSAGWEGRTTSTAARGLPTASEYAQIRARAFIDGAEGTVGAVFNGADTVLATAQAGVQWFDQASDGWMALNPAGRFGKDVVVSMVDGAISGGRVITNRDMGLATIGALENPGQTVAAMRAAFHEASWYDIAVGGTAAVASLGTGALLSRAGALGRAGAVRHTLAVDSWADVGVVRKFDNGRALLVDFDAGDVLPGFYRADPRQLRFTQSDASPNFVDSQTRAQIGTINDLVNDLRSGIVTPDDVGRPLQVVMHQGKPFSVDNRRLVAFNMADVPDVPIQVVSLKDPGVAGRFFSRFDPVGGEGYNIVITNTAGRRTAQELLRELGLINGNQL